MSYQERREWRKTHAAYAFGLIALIALPGCALFEPSRPARVYTPDIIGPIEDIRSVPGDRLAREAVVGDDGIRYTADWPRDLGFSGSKGSLLIYGSEGDDAWLLTVERQSSGELEGCYTLPADGVYDAGEHLVFTVAPGEGIRLPKAPTTKFPAPDSDTGRYPSSPSGAYCLDSAGTVIGSDLPGGALP